MVENILIVRMTRTLSYVMRISKLPRPEYVILARTLLKVVHLFVQCQIMAKPLIGAILVIQITFFRIIVSNKKLFYVLI